LFFLLELLDIFWCEHIFNHNCNFINLHFLWTSEAYWKSVTNLINRCLQVIKRMLLIFCSSNDNTVAIFLSKSSRRVHHFASSKVVSFTTNIKNRRCICKLLLLRLVKRYQIYNSENFQCIHLFLINNFLSQWFFLFCITEKIVKYRFKILLSPNLQTSHVFFNFLEYLPLFYKFHDKCLSQRFANSFILYITNQSNRDNFYILSSSIKDRARNNRYIMFTKSPAHPPYFLISFDISFRNIDFRFLFLQSQ
jgi:hypothetical protein